ncbi:hypothetical protein [Xanthocytophaga flava]|uniref:hypothetical protein n=1 Tax=Xanthocytophaga flava TaxID=3048013 RepID=UPI0028D0424C|nr:hypothetical protein [Xanthocytophaga flavus]MDJ1473090.1 hypothetical protein [Xanthocytophaga flavus]
MTDPQTIQEPQIIIGEEAIRKRPYMYIGGRASDGDGIINLICSLLQDCIEACQSNQLFFSVKVAQENRFCLIIEGHDNMNGFLELFQLDLQDTIPDKYIPKVLTVISDQLQVISGQQIILSKGESMPALYESSSHESPLERVVIQFHIDPTIIPVAEIDYQVLSEKLCQRAILYKGLQILLTDTRQKYVNQNYYHFPEGIAYLYERVLKLIPGKAEIEIHYEGKIQDTYYQIILVYRTDWDPSPYFLHFYNDRDNSDGSQVKEAIEDALVAACKRYVKKNKISNHKIQKKKLDNGLILICNMQNHISSLAEYSKQLESRLIYQQVHSIMYPLISSYFIANPEKTQDFLYRFDQTSITHKLFSK